MLNGLWRNADFVRLWTSLTITHFGGQITFLALPLTAALLLNATPFEMGVLTALESIPFALFGLFVGVLVDRAPKLPIIVWSDIGRALALLVVPLFAWLGHLSMGVLYVVGFLIGTGAALAWSIAVWQIFRHAYIDIVVLFAARELGFSAGRVGALWMLAGLGTLGAAGAVEPLNRRFGFGPTMVGGIFGTGVAWLVIGAA